MSRVDDARRRAAVMAADSLAIVPMPGLPVGPDLDTIEAIFPDERSERQQTRARTVQTPPVPPKSPATNDVAPVVQPKSSATVPAAPPVPLLETMDAAFGEKVVIDERTASIPREQYRRVAGVLHEAQRSKSLRVVMVASAVGGEGKTLTAINLALTLSESYRKRVLLVDGDFRSPSLPRAFPLTPVVPVGETSKASGMELGFGEVSPTLTFLTSRAPTADPMADLTSERMKELIANARRTFDWVVVDTPPVVVLPDAPLLGSMVDGVVLVIRAGSTAHALVARAIDSLGRSRILGVVLNDVRADLDELDDKRYRPGARIPS